MSNVTIEPAPVNTPFGLAKVRVDRYQRLPRAPFVFLQGMDDGLTLGVLSVNPPQGVVLKEGEVCIKTWSENEPLVAPMLASGLFKDTGKRLDMGYVEAQIWTASKELASLIPG